MITVRLNNLKGEKNGINTTFNYFTRESVRF